MTVKCPYGEKKGFAVYCKVLRKKVSPLKYPCMADYTKCPHYREAVASLKKTESASRPTEVIVEKIVEKRSGTPPSKTAASLPTPFKPPEQARTCEECMFYSALTGYCMKLRVKVGDPRRPPCKSGQ